MNHKKISLLLSCTFCALLSPLFAGQENISQDVSVQAPQVPVVAEMKTHEPILKFTGRVIGNKVRVRSQPTLESFVVRETNAGEMFAITGQDKDFYVIQPPKGTKGFVFRTFILDNVVEGDRVNIRLAPDIDSPIIGQLRTGDKVNAVTCPANNKWLEVSLPNTTHFYVAKEYIENAGPIELIQEVESRREQAFHLLNAAFHYAQSEIQKPFDEINLEGINQRFTSLAQTYSEFHDIAEKAKEANRTIEETFVQKKIAFLESKADRTMASRDFDKRDLQKFTQLGSELKNSMVLENMSEVGHAASSSLGHSLVRNDAVITDKMLVWQSLEESLYHLWASTHEGKSMEEFYAEEIVNATVVTGIVESFNRPVKNRPGDYILRKDNLPVAFLYSTKINLQELVGKRVTLMTTPRPNNNFAFPAYFVLSIE